MRISDWISDVCSSDLNAALEQRPFEYARKHAYVGCVTVSDSVQRVPDPVYVIVILAMIAGFLALRLYSVLGKRTGHEQEPALRPAEQRAKGTSVQSRPRSDRRRLGQQVVCTGRCRVWPSH